MKHRKETDESGEITYHFVSVTAVTKDEAIEAATVVQPLYCNGIGLKFCKVFNTEQTKGGWVVTLKEGWDV